MSRQIMVGGVAVGGGAPVSIQSMCNTATEDVEATVQQILRLEQAGCEIIRVAVPTEEAARAVPAIKARIHIPLVADIHFDYKLALLCGPWRMPAASGASPSASVSMAGHWKKTCWPGTAASRPRRWWTAPWGMSGC